MKVSAFVGAFFLLSLCWDAYGLEPAVTSTCSNDWLITRIKRRPFENDTEIRKTDIHLGKNCTVTRTLTFTYEFSYPVIDCGIHKLVFQGSVFMLSEITYRPTLDAAHKFHVVCFVKRINYPMVTVFRIPFIPEVQEQAVHTFVGLHCRGAITLAPRGVVASV